MTAPSSTTYSVIRTPDQRLRVFVSSTLQELADERKAAREAVTGLRLSPVMFELGARPHPPRELYRAYLEQSHIFIGIYWQKYGWGAPGMGISRLGGGNRLPGGRGRAEDRARAGEWLRCTDVGLLPLPGAGGTGKTRLAIQIATELLDDFE